MVKKPVIREDASSSTSKAKSASKPRKAPTKRKADQGSQSESEDEQPIAKKTKREKPAAGEVSMTDSGESFIALGKQKRASISSFKGTAYVNIREYYGAPGDEKPGKKGIALSKEQWEVLKSNADIIDRLLAEVGK